MTRVKPAAPRTTAKAKATSVTKKCPNCEQRAVFKFRPFCSARCANIDLGRWLKGDYAIPTDEPVSFMDPDEAQ